MSDIIRKDDGGILGDLAGIICTAMNSFGYFAIPYGGEAEVIGVCIVLVCLPGETKTFLTVDVHDGFMSVEFDIVAGSNVNTIVNALNTGGFPAMPITTVDEENNFHHTNAGVFSGNFLGTVPFTFIVTEGWLA